MIHMLDKKHKMLVNKKVSNNIRKHAKQGAEIPGYNKYLKNQKKGHIQTTHAVQTKTLDSY